MANNEAKIHNTFAKALNQLENLRSAFRPSGKFAQAVAAAGGDINYLQDIDGAFSELLETMYDAEYGMSAQMSGANPQEEVEELDELSKNTVRSYYNKAGEQGSKIAGNIKVGGGDWSKDGENTKTLAKRAAGRAMALKRRSGEVKMSEEVEVDGKKYKVQESKDLSSLKVLAGL